MAELDRPESTSAGVQVRQQRVNDPHTDESDRALKEFGNEQVPLWLTDADHYSRGSLDLHIHCSFGDVHACAVFHGAVRAEVPISPTQTAHFGERPFAVHV